MAKKASKRRKPKKTKAEPSSDHATGGAEDATDSQTANSYLAATVESDDSIITAPSSSPGRSTLLTQLEKSTEHSTKRASACEQVQGETAGPLSWKVKARAAAADTSTAPQADQELPLVPPNFIASKPSETPKQSRRNKGKAPQPQEFTSASSINRCPITPFEKLEAEPHKVNEGKTPLTQETQEDQEAAPTPCSQTSPRPTTPFEEITAEEIQAAVEAAEGVDVFYQGGWRLTWRPWFFFSSAASSSHRRQQEQSIPPPHADLVGASPSPSPLSSSWDEVWDWDGHGHGHGHGHGNGDGHEDEEHDEGEEDGYLVGILLVPRTGGGGMNPED